MPTSMRVVVLLAWPLVCMAISFVVTFTSEEKYMVKIVVVSRDFILLIRTINDNGIHRRIK